MKKTALFSIFIYAISSCNLEEPLFSCDPDVNNFVTKNLTVLKNMDRGSLCQYNEEVQKAIFRSLNPEKRFELWQNKLEGVLCNVYLSENEYEHVYNLLKYIDITLFEEESESELNKGKDREFAKQWILYARETLLWPTEKIAFIVSSLEVDFDIYLQERMAINDLRMEAMANSEMSCSCNTSSDFCGSALTCISSSCSSSGTGCGWFWMDSCNGSCSY